MNKLFLLMITSLLFLASCKTELPTPIGQDASQEFELPVVEGRFSKNINVSTTDGNTSFVLELSADDNELIKNISESDLLLSINTDENDEVEKEEANLEPNSVIGKSINLKIVNVDSNIEIENYRITFSNNFQSFMFENNIGMIIDLTPPNIDKSSKSEGGYYNVPCSKKLKLVDTSNALGKAQVWLYWHSNCSSNPNNWSDCYASFYNYTYRSVCYCGNSSKYWRKIYIQNSASYTAYSAC